IVLVPPTLGWKLIEGGTTSPESKIDIIITSSVRGYEKDLDYSFIDEREARASVLMTMRHPDRLPGPPFVIQEANNEKVPTCNCPHPNLRPRVRRRSQRRDGRYPRGA